MVVRASGAISTTKWYGCTLPPDGACAAARRQCSMSSAVTGGSSDSRRIERVVMMAS